MKQSEEGPESSTADQTLNMYSVVQDLHGIASKEISKMLKDSENFTIQWNTQSGCLRQVDMEKFANSLPLHLIAVLLSSDNMQATHLLCGVRLLHTLSDVASRHSRLEQILLDDVKVSEQLIDLVFFMLIVLAQTEQGFGRGTPMPLLHSALVACTFHLLTNYISSQWPELVHVLLAHPKVDIFMDVASDAVHADIRLLHVKFRELENSFSCKSLSLTEGERAANFICQQCEASLQFLLSLCQQKLFRDRLLRNKDICRTGSILSLCHTILKLKVANSFLESLAIVAAVSRLQSKALSILLQLCEAESVSYLDEIAGSSKNMHLAKSVALLILDILKTAFGKDAKQIGLSIDRSNPKGLVLLNSLRLADIYSDDSNFRSFFMLNAIHVLIEILGITRDEFQSNWCSADIPTIEEDSNLEYDPFTAAGMALKFIKPSVSPDETDFGSHFSFSGAVPSTTYAQQRTSNLVKIIANLHCFVPNICDEEERDLFLKKIHKGLCTTASETSGYPSNLGARKVKSVCDNLSLLADHAASLIPNLLNDEDVNLLRVFTEQLKKLVPPQINQCVTEELDVKNADSTPIKSEEPPMHQSLPTWTSISNPRCSKMDHVQDVQNTLGDTSSTLGKHEISTQEESPSFKEELKQHIIISRHQVSINETNLDQNSSITHSSIIEKVNQKAEDEITTKVDTEMVLESKEIGRESGLQDDDKVDNVQPRKRKRNIMNEKQINLIEKALAGEPEMQKNLPALQSWAETLSALGSEITPSQLKNWLNNRKAKLARMARETRTPSEGENTFPDNKTSGPTTSHFHESPESANEEPYNANVQDRSDHRVHSTLKSTPNPNISYSFKSNDLKLGQPVMLIDGEGNEVGKGKVFQVEGRWQGSNLEEVGVCIVDFTELKVEKSKEVQYPSESGGKTFEEAMVKNGGVARVAWDVVRVRHLPH